MKKRRTYTIALVLFAVYSLTALAPLASLALKSPAIAHAVSVECSGNCATCGCSPERSASRTCCCWMKKRMEKEVHPGVPSCCPAGGKMRGNGAAAANPAKSGKSKKRLTLYRCCPCGKEKLALPAGMESYPHLPSRFNDEFRGPSGDARTEQLTSYLISRHREPPDPPPKVFLRS